MPPAKHPAYHVVSSELGSHNRGLTKPTQWEPRVESLIQEVLANGYVIIPRAFDKAEIDEAKAELTRLASSGQGGPAGTKGRNAFEGFRTGRIYALLDKSRVFDKFVSHPDVLALNDYFLDPGYLINAFHSISIQPGEKAQTLHHDDGHIKVARPHAPFGTASI